MGHKINDYELLSREVSSRKKMGHSTRKYSQDPFKMFAVDSQSSFWHQIKKKKKKKKKLKQYQTPNFPKLYQLTKAPQSFM